MDYNKEKLYNISTEKEFREFMEKADEADTRDAIEPDDGKSACEYMGIKYSDNEFDEFIKRIERAYWEQWRYLALRHNIGGDLNGKKRLN